MSIDRAVMAFAGLVVLISLALGIWAHTGWFWPTAFVGANLLQASFTGFCPVAMILRRLGLKPGAAF
ncbi:MAG: DUF2892 domain-containing protein [Gammaproteobacteria bacterium]|nr:DUF2892 domain-containing protein [Gammaproteobacteria bacterium]